MSFAFSIDVHRARADPYRFRLSVSLRQRVTKGEGSREKGLLMAFKLLRMAPGQIATARAAGAGRGSLS